ncbi:MAG: SH3 domain-containing protein [Aggregatilineales bacterium]
MDEYGYDSWKPIDWSSDGSQILYQATAGGFPSTEIRFFDVNLETATPSFLWGFTTNQVLSELATYPVISNYVIADIFTVERNPVYGHWSVIQFQIGESENAPPDLTLLWNLQNNSFIPISSPIQGQNIIAFPPTWHNNGKELIVMTMDSTRQLYITLWDFSEDGTLILTDSAPSDRQVLFSLGAGDILIARNIDDPSTYYLGEVINGQWFETPFLQFPTSFGNISSGDWYLTASEAERAMLSCLFDQTLASRLTLGVSGQVAFTDGTASRLRQAPGTDQLEIALMPEGTEFTVIGDPYCKDGFRWINIQLSDNITGWAAEASTTSYFLEPLETNETSTP